MKVLRMSDKKKNNYKKTKKSHKMFSALVSVLYHVRVVWWSLDLKCAPCYITDFKIISRSSIYTQLDENH